MRDIAAKGGTVLFVGTKKQSRDAIASHAARAGMPYVNHRWLGGLLTNFRTMSGRIEHLHDLRRQSTDGQLDLLPTKERIARLKELEKLETNIGGVADLRRLPQAVFVIDLKAEELAVREARRLNIPLIGLVDTNCDPDEVDLVVPGNDDAIRSCDLICRVLADAVIEGRGPQVTEEELAAEGARRGRLDRGGRRRGARRRGHHDRRRAGRARRRRRRGSAAEAAPGSRARGCNGSGRGTRGAGRGGTRRGARRPRSAAPWPWPTRRPPPRPRRRDEETKDQ